MKNLASLTGFNPNIMTVVRPWIQDIQGGPKK